MQKKKLLMLSGIGAGIDVFIFMFLFLGSGVELGFCSFAGTWCFSLIENAFWTIFPLTLLFIFSLITYKMREETYRRWWGFARWWTPLSVVLIIGASNASAVLDPVTQKGYILLLCSGIFIAISILIIIWKSLSSRQVR